MVTSTSSSRGYRLKPGLATSATLDDANASSVKYLSFSIGRCVSHDLKGCASREGKSVSTTKAYLARRPMRITVHILPVKKETLVVDLPQGDTVERLMRSLDILPDAWIAVMGGEPVPIDRRLEDGDVVKLVSVVSGG